MAILSVHFLGVQLWESLLIFVSVVIIIQLGSISHSSLLNSDKAFKENFLWSK